MTRTRAVALALAIGALAASPAGAQLIPRPIRLGIGGGPTGVAGTMADNLNAGFHLTGALDVGIPLFPLGLRVDGAWHSFSGKDDNPDFRILNATADATMNLLPLPIIKPYAIGGVGVYNTKAKGGGDVVADAVTRTGYNVGAGVRFDLAGFGAFAEARYHYLPKKGDDVKLQFYPVTVGLRF